MELTPEQWRQLDAFSDRAGTDGSEYRHLLAKCREAQNGGWGTLSTLETLGAALVLNRFDLLQQLGCTIAEAVDRVGPKWSNVLVHVQRELAE